MLERTKAASRRIMHEMLPGDNYVIRIRNFPDYTRIREILYGFDTAIWQAEGNLNLKRPMAENALDFLSYKDYSPDIGKMFNDAGEGLEVF